jgi:expansin (peptidoglycan-binding protein)
MFPKMWPPQKTHAMTILQTTGLKPGAYILQPLSVDGSHGAVRDAIALGRRKRAIQGRCLLGQGPSSKSKYDFNRS